MIFVLQLETNLKFINVPKPFCEELCIWLEILVMYLVANWYSCYAIALQSYVDWL